MSNEDSAIINGYTTYKYTCDFKQNNRYPVTTQHRVIVQFQNLHRKDTNLRISV